MEKRNTLSAQWSGTTRMSMLCVRTTAMGQIHMDITRVEMHVLDPRMNYAEIIKKWKV